MPQMRNPFRRTTVLARPKPCSFAEAQHSLDRLVAAGIDAEIVEHADNGLNMWANTKVGGEVTPDERYVIRVPRRQAAAADQSDLDERLPIGQAGTAASYNAIVSTGGASEGELTADRTSGMSVPSRLSGWLSGWPSSVPSGR